MSKQVLVVSNQPSSLRRRLAVAAVVVGLVVWFIKSPVEAANGVRTGWDGFMAAADAVGTFIGSVLG